MYAKCGSHVESTQVLVVSVYEEQERSGISKGNARSTVLFVRRRAIIIIHRTPPVPL